MELMKKMIWLIFIVSSLLSCSSSKQNKNDKSVTNTQKRVVDAHNARNSLDYQGTYTGVIPGYECKAVNISIVLTEREYVLHITPLRENAETVVRKGEYTWDENGSIITLKGVEDSMAKYFVAENQLRQLNAEGKQYVGKDAAHYILRKQWSNLSFS